MEDQSNKKIGIMIGAIILVSILIVGITYAYLSANKKANDRTVKAGTLLIEYEDDNVNSVKLENIVPIDDSDMMTNANKIAFKVNNKGTALAYVDISITNISLPDALKSTEFKWALYSNNEKVNSGNFSNVEDEGMSLVKNQEIASKASKNYELYIWITETDLDQSSMMEKTFSGKITINGHQYKVEQKELLSDIIKNNNSPIDTKEPDFTTTAETNEGLIEGEDSDGKTYYFRGNVNNNYVKIEGLKWTDDDGNYHRKDEDMLFRIVRINGDNSIRIIANGSIGTCKFNENMDMEQYVGYTFNNNKVCTKDAKCDGTEGTPSKIKTYLDDWYKNNIEEKYDSLFTTSRYCNDTSGTTNSYGAKDRLETKNTPTFICPDTEKMYGGEYNLKIGLLSADEAVFAGGKYNTINQNYYLVGSSNMRWFLSPNRFDGSAFAFELYFNNLINSDYVHNEYASVPVLNLRSDTSFTEGNGEKNTPYLVRVKN